MSPVSRREALALAGMLGAGGAVLLATRALRPVGEPLAPSPTLEAAFTEVRPEAGAPRADLVMLVFTDYNCGACRKAHPEMMAAVEADGAVRLRFLDWPIFGDDSRSAARAAIAAAGQGLYPEVHAQLMQGGRADGAAAETAVTAAGGSADLLRATLARDSAAIEGQLARNAFHAFSLGLGGTPAHLAGRLLLRGTATEREFRRAFAQARDLQ
jgi:protein-disulfide isomerase